MPGRRIQSHASGSPRGEAAELSRQLLDTLHRRASAAEETDAFRLLHGASDGWPGWYVDRLGEQVLSASEPALSRDRLAALKTLLDSSADFLPKGGLRGVYHKRLDRHVRDADAGEASPELVCGSAAPERFRIRENGLAFELSFGAGYSPGIFLDQRENRRRLIAAEVEPGFPLFERMQGRRPKALNTFAYTCAFSVAAARAGASVTSLDLSRNYLEWGRRNFSLNQLDPAEHDFIYGDAFHWMKRLARKGRRFDLVILDPPTFSKSKESGVFRTGSDYGSLVTSALSLLEREGVLLACCNTVSLPEASFRRMIHRAIAESGSGIVQSFAAEQPGDFRPTQQEPAYLKAHWLRVRKG